MNPSVGNMFFPLASHAADGSLSVVLKGSGACGFDVVPVWNPELNPELSQLNPKGGPYDSVLVPVGQEPEPIRYTKYDQKVAKKNTPDETTAPG